MSNLTYLGLNLTFVLIAWLIVRRLQPVITQTIILTTIATYLLMVVFNTYLTSLPIVRYDWNRVLGIKMISWPIEDMAYLVVALYLGTALYQRLLTYYEKDTPPPPSSHPRRNHTPSKSARRTRGSSHR